MYFTVFSQTVLGFPGVFFFFSCTSRCFFFDTPGSTISTTVKYNSRSKVQLFKIDRLETPWSTSLGWTSRWFVFTSVLRISQRNTVKYKSWLDFTMVCIYHYFPQFDLPSTEEIDAFPADKFLIAASSYPVPRGRPSKKRLMGAIDFWGKKAKRARNTPGLTWDLRYQIHIMDRWYDFLRRCWCYFSSCSSSNRWFTSWIVKKKRAAFRSS